MHFLLRKVHALRAPAPRNLLRVDAPEIGIGFSVGFLALRTVLALARSLRMALLGETCGSEPTWPVISMVGYTSRELAALSSGRSVSLTLTSRRSHL